MLEKIIGALMRLRLRSIVKEGGLACPSCGLPHPEIPEEMDAVIRCSSACGFLGSVQEWMSASVGTSRRGRAGFPPPGTAITMRRTGSLTVWDLPPPGRSGGLMRYGVMWTLGVILFTAIVIHSLGSKGGSQGVSGWMILIPFWAVGGGMLYFACRRKYARHQVIIKNGEITLSREWLGRRAEKSLPLADVTDVCQKGTHMKNRRSVYRIEIQTEADKLEFGRLLREGERAWIVAEIVHAIWPSRLAEDRVEPSMPGPVGRTPFVVSVPPSPLVIVFGFLLLAVVAVVAVPIVRSAITHFPGAVSDSNGDPVGRIFDIVVVGFSGLWSILLVAVLLLGVSVLWSALRNLGVEKQIEGNERRLFIRRIRKGKILEEREYVRSSFRDIRSFHAGHNNHREMKRVELLFDDKAEQLAMWMAGEEADELVEKVKLAMR